MAIRCARSIKKEKTYEAGIDTLIERLKKVRALNCNPSDVGMDGCIWKKFFPGTRFQALTKFL